MKKFYTPKEVAEMYDLHYTTVINYIHNGLFGLVRKALGRTGRLKLSDENLQTFDNNLLKL
jgi:predicted site-specific integrase-resolvase